MMAQVIERREQRQHAPYQPARPAARPWLGPAPLRRTAPLVSHGELQQAARRLTGSLRSGTASETAYDTAIVARLRSRTNVGQLAFPAALTWLRRHQHPDGSWGGRLALPHDRLVCTLAAIVCLAEVAEDWAQLAVQAGVASLWRQARAWRQSPHETVAFELLVPQLLDEARRLELALPYEVYAPIMALRDEKLRRLPPPDRLFAQPTTLLHSLEGLGGAVDPVQLQRLRGRNGSYGNSPSSTAHVLAYLDDDEAAAYLREVLAVSVNGGAPTVFPFEVFERAWVLYNLGYAGYTDERVLAHQRYLQAALGPDGVAIAADGLIPDCDDTAMVLIVLARAGLAADLSALHPFEGEACYRCFPHERNTSVTANARALEAIKVASGGARQDYLPQTTKLVRYLQEQRQAGGYWQDKWHASPYYATAQVALAAHGVADAVLDGTVDWLLATQHDDGLWGRYGGTSEETAYAIQALWTLAPHDRPAVRSALLRGAVALSERFEDTDYAELWIGKGLYTPYAVVRSAVIGALLLCHQASLADG